MFKKLLLFVSVFGFIHCDALLKSDFQDGENIEATQADPSQLLNNIQLESKSLFGAASFSGGEYTRMNYMYGDTYTYAVSPRNYNYMYERAYSGIFADANTLIEIAEDRNFYVHAGIAKILKAYTMITIVDFFGDMPYSDEFDGTELNPPLVDDELIYTKAIDLLNDGVSDMQNPLNRATPNFDFYFDVGSSEYVNSWIRTANTIMLKAYLNMGKTLEVNELISGGKLITDSSHDFQFNYSSNASDPDSRHPNYINNYAFGGYVDYLSISYLNMLLTDKEFIDPRMNYYFYRQYINDGNDSHCKPWYPPHFDADDPRTCLPFGYTGQNHLDEGIGLNCNSSGTTYGVYPAGGKFDESIVGFDYVEDGDGLGGAGIEPILLSAFTYFMIAEAELTLNNDPVKARLALETSLEHSFTNVADFGADLATGTGFEITDSTITAYTNVVLDRFDNAPDHTEKLRVIAREYYFALWGNGYEAYNLMRRTGFPDRDDNLQPARSPNPGNWPRSVYYPANMIERNENIEQKSNADFLIGPFWDPDKGSTKFNF
ncbi:MAG: SusD/RagB family nutrient-binding outer membrane lipoprotein [Balneolaceae bacterium]|nr:SusD/RagB family nutrient-binding outer membrane lipoprotein [Balneolaceae bacterium]